MSPTSTIRTSFSSSSKVTPSYRLSRRRGECIQATWYTFHAMSCMPFAAGPRVSAHCLFRSAIKSPKEPDTRRRSCRKLLGLTRHRERVKRGSSSTAALIATGWSDPVPGRVYPRCHPTKYDFLPWRFYRKRVIFRRYGLLALACRQLDRAEAVDNMRFYRPTGSDWAITNSVNLRTSALERNGRRAVMASLATPWTMVHASKAI